MLAARFAGRAWTKGLSPHPVGLWTDVRADAQPLAYTGKLANTEVKGHD